jgi:hypothetical protein
MCGCGGVQGLPTPHCEGRCFPGFFCPAGSTSPKQLACGGPDYYCPGGSSPLPFFAMPETTAGSSYETRVLFIMVDGGTLTGEGLACSVCAEGSGFPIQVAEGYYTSLWPGVAYNASHPAGWYYSNM